MNSKLKSGNCSIACEVFAISDTTTDRFAWDTRNSISIELGQAVTSTFIFFNSLADDDIDLFADEHHQRA